MKSFASRDLESTKLNNFEPETGHELYARNWNIEKNHGVEVYHFSYYAGLVSMDVGLVLQAQAGHNEGLNAVMSSLAARTEQRYHLSDIIVPFAGKTGFGRL